LKAAYSHIVAPAPTREMIDSRVMVMSQLDRRQPNRQAKN
jgi:hypothetical protein